MISLVYLTNRKEPQFHWFVDSLANQTSENERVDIEIIFVDAVLEQPDYNADQRREELKQIVNGRFKYFHCPPKGNIYQGYSRKTKSEMFAPSNARNTGVRNAAGSYIAFIDDVSILMPTWYAAVKKAWEQNLIVCGAYQKHFEMNVQNGILVSSRAHPAGRDARWNRGNESYPVPLSGNELYGSSFGIPKDIFNSVGGFDEICDSIGGEDYHFGIRLNFAGHKLHYSRAMYTVESEELHAQPYRMWRDDRVLSPEKYMERLAEFGVHQRYQRGNWDSSHMILDLLYGKRHIMPLGVNGSDEHWFDKKPLAEL